MLVRTTGFSHRETPEKGRSNRRYGEGARETERERSREGGWGREMNKREGPRGREWEDGRGRQ